MTPVAPHVRIVVASIEPKEGAIYTLGYPNREVEMSLNRALLVGYGVPQRPAFDSRRRLLDILKSVEPMLKALFASIPHDWYRNSPLAGFEGHYASVCYSHFAALGLGIRLEDTINHGRIDMAVLFRQQVFVFEFSREARNVGGFAVETVA